MSDDAPRVSVSQSWNRASARRVSSSHREDAGWRDGCAPALLARTQRVRALRSRQHALPAKRRVLARTSRPQGAKAPAPVECGHRVRASGAGAGEKSGAPTPPPGAPRRLRRGATGRCSAAQRRARTPRQRRGSPRAQRRTGRAGTRPQGGAAGPRARPRPRRA